MIDILTVVYRIIYDACFSLTDSYGWSLVAMSFVTAFLIEPFKKLTESARSKEHLQRSILEPKLKAIRKDYFGAERHERIAKLYRKYSYHPLYSFRALLGVLLQVPLLYAAFTMLSSHEGLVGVPFLLIRDLSKPDSLAGGVNALPFLMTGFNLAALAYTPNFRRTDYIQGAVIAGMFLILLYSAPSALLIYWTVNNAIFAFRSVFARFMPGSNFSSTILRRRRSDPRLPLPPAVGTLYACIPPAGFIATCFASMIPDSADTSVIAVWLLLFVHLAVSMLIAFRADRSGTGTSPGTIRKFSLFILLCALYPLFLHYDILLPIYSFFAILWFVLRPISSSPRRELMVLLASCMVFVGYALLAPTPVLPIYYVQFLLLLVLQWVKYRYRGENSPSGFIDVWPRLFPGKVGAYYIASMTALGVLLVLFSPSAVYASSQLDFNGLSGMTIFANHLGMLVFWLVFSYIIWAWLRSEWRPWATMVLCLVTVSSLLQATVLVNDFGALDLSRFQIVFDNFTLPLWKDGASLGLAALALFLCALLKRGRYIYHALWLAAIGMFLFCVQLLFIGPGEKPVFEDSYTLSSISPNTLLIMLDTFTAEHVRDAMEEKNGLRSSFRGFTWFEDTLANGGSTLLSLPAMLGGREYAPEEINRNPERTRLDKTLEAFASLPNLAVENGMRVAMSDPCSWVMMPYSVSLLKERLTRPESVSIFNTLDCEDQLVREFLEKTGGDSAISGINRNVMSTFLLAVSLFRAAPQIVKSSIYDQANWLHSPDDIMRLRYYQVSKQVAMLANLSSAFTVDKGPPTLNMYFNNMLHRPYLLGRDSLAIRDSVQPQYYSAIHALKMLGEFFVWMRRNGVFDNTQIIVASDHSGYLVDFPRRIRDQATQTVWNIYRPNALLMIKPFNTDAPFSVSDIPMQVSDIHDMLVGKRLLSDLANAHSGSAPRTRLVHYGGWRWSNHPENTLRLITSAVAGSQFDSVNWQEVNTPSR